MGTVLLYNIYDTEKRMGVKRALFRLGLRALDVQPEDFCHPIGYLLSLAGYAPGEGNEVFTDEMLLMHDLTPGEFTALLDALRRGGTPVALKAIATDTNLAWSSARLHRELAAEHAAMRRLKKPLHRK